MNINKMKELLDELDNLSEVYQVFKAKNTIDIPFSIRLTKSGLTFNIYQDTYSKIRTLIMNDIRKQINKVRSEIENEVNR